MTECAYRSCSRDADVVLEYNEPGTPVTTKSLCKDHAATEQIHDPYNTAVRRHI